MEYALTETLANFCTQLVTMKLLWYMFLLPLEMSLSIHIRVGFSLLDVDIVCLEISVASNTVREKGLVLYILFQKLIRRFLISQKLTYRSKMTRSLRSQRSSPIVSTMSQKMMHLGIDTHNPLKVGGLLVSSVSGVVVVS